MIYREAQTVRLKGTMRLGIVERVSDAAAMALVWWDDADECEYVYYRDEETIEVIK